MSIHHFEVDIRWTGNTGSGTSGYRNYERSHTISSPGKRQINASAHPAFRGDGSCYNPEEMFIASLSSCHMLWFLHLCSDAGVIVTSYIDKPIGIMEEGNDSDPGRFTKVTLRPKVEVLNVADTPTLTKLHHHAHRLCFIANSVNFAVEVIPEIN
jgi:organic hydroperoxide reductase OsmC/OhrA